jgi:hypothetical protein
VKSRAFRATAAFVVLLSIASATQWWLQRDPHTYLDGATAEFVAIFPEPPEPDSAVTRRELDELLDLQWARTETDVEDARNDRKTEIQRFYGALGFPAGAEPKLPLLRGLAERVEDDFRPYVRDAKEHFRRLRPYKSSRSSNPASTTYAATCRIPADTRRSRTSWPICCARWFRSGRRI